MPHPTLPPEDLLEPTQAVEPRPRLEKPTDVDVPAPELDDMTAPAVAPRDEPIEIGGP